MATPTTTFASIRRQMVATIKALTPTSITDDLFRLTESEAVDFAGWAEENAASTFREYEIIEGQTRRVDPADHQVEMRETDCEVVVAYPHQWGLYQHATVERTQRNRAAMRAILEEDASLIAKNIGIKGADNYVSGQHAAIEDDWNIDERRSVTLAVLPMRVLFYADVS